MITYPSPRRTRVLTTAMLRDMNRWAVKHRRNRSLTDECMAALDTDGLHVVGMAMVHNESEMRFQVFMKFAGVSAPQEGWLDIDLARWRLIPEVDLTELGVR